MWEASKTFAPAYMTRLSFRKTPAQPRAAAYIDTIIRIAPNGTMTSFALPGTTPLVSAMCLGPDGNMWFYDFFNDKLGYITQAGAITEYNFSGSYQTNMVTGPDQAIWLTTPTDRTIYRVTTSGVITTYSLGSPSLSAGAIIVGPDNALWMQGTDQDVIIRMTLSGTITTYQLPPGLVPSNAEAFYGLAVGSDGAIYFNEQFLNEIGRITTNGTVTFYPIPLANSQPGVLVPGPNNAIWFSEVSQPDVGKITP